MNTELFVQYHEKCTHSKRESGQYGSWSEEYDFYVKGVGLTARNRWQEEKITVEADVKAGESVFVLYMIYSTGDSFGQAEGKGEVLWVFKDASIAIKALAVWEETTKGREYSIEFEVDGGKKIKLTNPAAGYFENVGTIDLAAFLVNP